MKDIYLCVIIVGYPIRQCSRLYVPSSVSIYSLTREYDFPLPLYSCDVSMRLSWSHIDTASYTYNQSDCISQKHLFCRINDNINRTCVGFVIGDLQSNALDIFGATYSVSPTCTQNIFVDRFYYFRYMYTYCDIIVK